MRFFLFFLLSVISFNSYTFVIVSDYDDKMKVANVDNQVDVVVRGIMSNRLFVGVPQVYQGLTEWGTLFVVSGSPSLLRPKISENLRVNQIPATLILKPLTQSDLYAYKLNTLRKLQKAGHGPFILIGDDTQHDPEIFLDFQSEFPTQVEAIYIRKVTGRDLPATVTSFFTSYELAFYENKERRVSDEYLAKVEESILDIYYDLELFPLFTVCPEKAEEIAGHREMKTEVVQHIIKMCQ